MTSCGALVPCRLENVTRSLVAPLSVKLYSPLPVTSGVTSYSTQVPSAACWLVARAEPVMAGRVFQVRPVSVQVALAVW